MRAKLIALEAPTMGIPFAANEVLQEKELWRGGRSRWISSFFSHCQSDGT
jgi:hypothetical protein